MPDDSIQETKPVTLESLFADFQFWRENKSSYPNRAVPDELWKNVFALSEHGRYSDSDLRQIFKLNSAQYERKYQELIAKPSNLAKKNDVEQKSTTVNEQPSPINFKEIAIRPQMTIPELKEAGEKTKAALKKIKSTDSSYTDSLELTTVVVECIRSDGQRLKIHTTDQRLDVVMQAFFNEGHRL